MGILTLDTNGEQRLTWSTKRSGLQNFDDIVREEPNHRAFSVTWYHGRTPNILVAYWRIDDDKSLEAVNAMRNSIRQEHGIEELDMQIAQADPTRCHVITQCCIGYLMVRSCSLSEA